MTVRSISIEAYNRHIESGKRWTQWMKIYRYLYDSWPMRYTRSEISDKTGMRLSSVCGRVNELIKAGMLEEGGRHECRITKEQAHTVTLKVSDPRQGGLFDV
jgi:predicted transcriptional regulator